MQKFKRYKMPMPEEIERGLTDGDWKVRLVWARRSGFIPTPEQIERGLTDENWLVRLAWAERLDYKPTPEQIERGLTDKNWRVRVAWAKRRDYTPTLAQIERGLKDKNKEVVKQFILRLDYRIQFSVADDISNKCHGFKTYQHNPDVELYYLWKARSIIEKIVFFYRELRMIKTYNVKVVDPASFEVISVPDTALDATECARKYKEARENRRFENAHV